MSDARKRARDSLTTVGVPLEFLTDTDVKRWVLPSHPLHAAFRHLSAVHQSDYLRTYLMHHYGGGYTDVKMTRASWVPFFDALQDGRYLGAGSREVSRHGVANMGVDFSRGRYRAALSPNWWHLRWLQVNYRKLLANGAYIFVPRTRFTSEWLSELDRRLDRLSPALQAHPAQHPRERPGQLVDGAPSSYPVPWTYLLGDIFHPLSYRYRRILLRGLPAPG